MNFAAILAMLFQYGPEAVTVIENLIAKLEGGGTVTVADVQKEFAGLKPYDAYGIALAQPAAPAPGVAANPSPAFVPPPTPSP